MTIHEYTCGHKLEAGKDMLIPNVCHKCGKGELTYYATESSTSNRAIHAFEFLEAGISHMKDRAATYDSPEGERSMGKVVATFAALTGIEMTETQGWKFMCCLKLVRSEQGAFRSDNYEDLAAFAGLAGESDSRERS